MALTEKPQKISGSLYGRIDKYEYLTGERNITFWLKKQ